MDEHDESKSNTVHTDNRHRCQRPICSNVKLRLNSHRKKCLANKGSDDFDAQDQIARSQSLQDAMRGDLAAIFLLRMSLTRGAD